MIHEPPETINEHFQRLASAVSDLLNDEHLSSEDVRDLIAKAWRYAQLGDWCNGHIDDLSNDTPPYPNRTVWPFLVEEGCPEGGTKAFYVCPDCEPARGWKVYWAASLLNREGPR